MSDESCGDRPLPLASAIHNLRAQRRPITAAGGTTRCRARLLIAPGRTMREATQHGGEADGFVVSGRLTCCAESLDYMGSIDVPSDVVF